MHLRLATAPPPIPCAACPLCRLLHHKLGPNRAFSQLAREYVPCVWQATLQTGVPAERAERSCSSSTRQPGNTFEP
jgi:hypothetical protein